jgi:hypothetical protein
MTKPKTKPPIAATPPQEFGPLLAWHMANGTRPDASGKPRESWRSDHLAQAARCNSASLRNWRRGRFVPGERHARGLADAFFGGNSFMAEQRKTFLESWTESCLAHRHGLLHIDKNNPEQVRSHVRRELSNLCRALDLSLSGVDAAALHLLGAATRRRREAA